MELQNSVQMVLKYLYILNEPNFLMRYIGGGMSKSERQAAQESRQSFRHGYIIIPGPSNSFRGFENKARPLLRANYIQWQLENTEGRVTYARGDEDVAIPEARDQLLNRPGTIRRIDIVENNQPPGISLQPLHGSVALEFFRSVCNLAQIQISGFVSAAKLAFSSRRVLLETNRTAE